MTYETGDDRYPLDRIENKCSERCSLNKNDGNMPFLSHEKMNKYICKEKTNNESNKENEVQSTSILEKHLSNDESESMDDDSRDKDFEIYEYTESESEVCSSSLNSDIIIPPVRETPLHKVPPVQSVIEKIKEQVREKFKKVTIFHIVFSVFCFYSFHTCKFK